MIISFHLLLSFSGKYSIPPQLFDTIAGLIVENKVSLTYLGGWCSPEDAYRFASKIVGKHQLRYLGLYAIMQFSYLSCDDVFVTVGISLEKNGVQNMPNYIKKFV